MCLNVARKGVSCGPSLRHLLAQYETTLVALSEADIPSPSRASLAKEWQAFGWHAAFAAPEMGICRLMLLSRIPFKQVQICHADGGSRHVACMFDFQGDTGIAPILVIGLYLQSGNPSLAQAQANDILAGAYSGRRCVVLGDWNMEQREGDVAMLLRNNVIQACDEAARGCELPHTGPFHKGSRRRRVDYAVTVGDLFATKVDHVPEEMIGALSDHRAVSYTFDLSAPLSPQGPRRRSFLDHEHLPCQDHNFSDADKALLSLYIESGNVDMAWSFLSDLAEDLLCKRPGRDTIPRGEDWLPSPRPLRKDRDPELDQSRGLRALRRLVPKLELCVRRPWDNMLIKATASSLPSLRALVPDLPFLVCGSAEAPALVQALLETYAKQERELHQHRWRSVTCYDSAKARSYIKRRADACLAFDNDLEDIEKVDNGWHPEQAEIWSGQWNRPWSPVIPEIDRILSVVPRPDLSSTKFFFTAEALRASMSVLRQKTGGADDWKPSALLLLPHSWWQGAAALWNAILKFQKVPHQWERVALLWKSKKRTRPITLLAALWRAGARCLKDQLSPWISTWQQHFDAGGLPSTSVANALMQVHHPLKFSNLQPLILHNWTWLPTLTRCTLRSFVKFSCVSASRRSSWASSVTSTMVLSAFSAYNLRTVSHGKGLLWVWRRGALFHHSSLQPLVMFGVYGFSKDPVKALWAP